MEEKCLMVLYILRSFCLFYLFLMPLAFPDASETFEGNWFWEGKNGNFSLELHQHGKKLTGVYCSIGDNGNRIDCSENPADRNIKGEVHGNKAELIFSTFYGAGMGNTPEDNLGKACIWFDRNGVLQWKVTQIPAHGLFWCPHRAVLT